MNRPVLEICVESLEYAVAAERGGADRIELCSDLFAGGVTPNSGLISKVRHRLSIPIHVLIRPRVGDFHYSEREIEAMADDIVAVKQLGVDGIVLGVLDGNRRIDVTRTSRLVKLAAPLPVTFHRAFDECRNLLCSLELVIETGAARILTAGGAASASRALGLLQDLVGAAGDRIDVMPGGGIDASNVQAVLLQTGARAVHTSVGMSRLGPSKKTLRDNGHDGALIPDRGQVETRVRQIRHLLDGMGAS